MKKVKLQSKYLTKISQR